MKTKFFLLIILALTLAACSSATPSAAPALDSYVSDTLDTNYDGAISARNQLALGTLRLADSANAISPEQAETLLPLWQVLLNSQKSGTGADAEINAVLQSIEESLTAEQIAAIKAMQLTQTDLQDWATASGVTLGSGTGQGQGQGMSPEARATRQAEEGRTPSSTGGGASTSLVSAVIEYLDQRTP